jgi:stalled ribosome rescue protein Dom34
MEEKILNYYYFQDILRCDMNFHMGFIKIPNKNKLINPIAEEIINNQKIGIISHCKVENFLNHYSSQVIIRIEIPKRRANFQRMTRKKYDVVLSEIKKYCSLVDIWLVAAGIYAKPFCEYIRQNEGIGIDIGSSMDSWINEYHSRGHLRRLASEHNEES